MNKFSIKINLSDKFPENFKPTYDDFTIRGLGFFKLTDSPEKKDFPFNSKLNEWRIEIIYDDYKCTAGSVIIPTKDNETIYSKSTGSVNEINVNYIFSKDSVDKEKNPIRWKTAFYNQLSPKNGNIIERNLRKLRGEVFEKVRQHKAILRHRKK